MKKIFTLFVAFAATTSMMAQATGPMTFAGKASFYVTNPQTGGQMGNTDVASDTVIVSNMSVPTSTADITIPKITYGKMVIPSFTITGTTFSFANMVATWEDQTFSVKISDTQSITGTSLTGKYIFASNTMDLTVKFTYPNMPMPITYSIKGYYVKPYTNNLTAVIGGSTEYYYQAIDKVTYNVRAYVDDSNNKLMDVQVPACSFTNTQMGDLYLGSYIIKGLTYDATGLTYSRNYTNDGDSVYFKGIGLDKYCKLNAGTQGTNVQKITVTVGTTGTVTKIVNQLQPGTMPFSIVYTFPDTKPTAIEDVSAETQRSSVNDQNTYNLAGQRVSAGVKGLVIRGGKKIFIK